MCRIVENMGLVYFVVRKYQPPSYYDEFDLVQIGMIGLIKADKNYDEEKKVQFQTFACVCIENELKMLLRRENKSKKVKETPFQSCIGEGYTLEEKLASSESIEKKVVLKEIFHDIGKDQDYQMMELIFINGMKHSDYALQVGLSCVEVSRLIKNFRVRNEDHHPLRAFV